MLHAGPPAKRAIHADDFQLYLRVAPWLKCLSGHAVRPWLLLEQGVTDCAFLGILRDPIARYVSYYTYGGGAELRQPWPYTFEEYLEKEEFHNYQTKRIAGTGDATQALKIITNHYWSFAHLQKMDTMLDRLDEIWSPQ
jgi:hypothetical protein